MCTCLSGSCRSDQPGQKVFKQVMLTASATVVRRVCGPGGPWHGVVDVRPHCGLIAPGKRHVKSRNLIQRSIAAEGRQLRSGSSVGGIFNGGPSPGRSDRPPVRRRAVRCPACRGSGRCRAGGGGSVSAPRCRVRQALGAVVVRYLSRRRRVVATVPVRVRGSVDGVGLGQQVHDEPGRDRIRSPATGQVSFRSGTTGGWRGRPVRPRRPRGAAHACADRRRTDSTNSATASPRVRRPRCWTGCPTRW